MALAKPIAPGQQEVPLAVVDDGGEHPVQVLEQSLSVFLVEMGDDLGVRSGAKHGIKRRQQAVTFVNQLRQLSTLDR